MDNNNLYNQGNQNGEQGQYQPQQPYQNSGGQYQQPYQQQAYQSGDDQFQKQQTYQPYQQPYQQNYGQYQPQTPYSSGDEVEEPISFGEWMITLLLLYIPCVNIIITLVWAFGSSTSRSKSNFAKAKLVWMVIGAVIGTIFSAIYLTAIVAMIESGGTYY